MTSSIGNKAAKGAVWASVDRFGSMALQFVVNLILARLLLPADFGAIGMLTIFIAVSQVLIDGGFGSALIQKKNPSQTDFSTIFYWNLLFSFILYFILFLFAPFIGRFYSMPILSDVLRAIGLSLIFNSILAIQRTKLQKALAFKTIAITNISSYLLGASIAIIMAYKGFGVWSLVGMQLLYTVIYVLILWFITKWHPSFRFSIRSMKELFGFGGYIMASNILQTVCQNLQGIIIGKNFSASQMGYYSQAYKLDQITSYSIPQVIIQVMYPVYASIQDDRKRLIDMISMNIRVISFFIFPILALLILVAEPLILFLYGDKWLPSVPYFRILCVGGFFVCLQNINFYAVAAIGKSRALFYWSFYKWGFLLAALLIGMNFEMYGILWGMVLSNLNIYLVNALLVQRYLEFSFSNQIRLLLPIILLCVITFAISKMLIMCNIPIIISIFVFGILYIVISYKTKSYSDCISLLKRICNKYS